MPFNILQIKGDKPLYFKKELVELVRVKLKNLSKYQFLLVLAPWPQFRCDLQQRI
jgi:hypothetical protein